MADHLTLGDLFRAKRITNDDLEAAVSAHLTDPTPGARQITESLTLEIATTVKASSYA